MSKLHSCTLEIGILRRLLDRNVPMELDDFLDLDNDRMSLAQALLRMWIRADVKECPAVDCIFRKITLAGIRRLEVYDNG